MVFSCEFLAAMLFRAVYRFFFEVDLLHMPQQSWVARKCCTAAILLACQPGRPMSNTEVILKVSLSCELLAAMLFKAVCRFFFYRVASGVRKIIDHQFFPPYYRLIIDFLTLYRPILSIFLFSGYLARLCTQPSEDFKNRLIGLTLTMYFKYCSLGKLEILKS